MVGRAPHSISIVLPVGAILGGCASVPTGRIGVEWTPLRGTETNTLSEGLHVVSPVARVYGLDLREQIEREICEEAAQKLAGKHGEVDAIRIREVHQPEAVQAAIQTKSEEEQTAREMQFVLDRTVRKHIEARGIADCRSIINKTSNDQVIEWKGIEAPEKLADSPNAKVFMVGSGENGLPAILNAAGATSPPQTASGGLVAPTRQNAAAP